MSGDDTFWPWDVLGISEHACEAELRRAYAQRLKALDIERQPDEFSALRAAYEFAREMVREHGRKKASDGTSVAETTDAPRPETPSRQEADQEQVLPSVDAAVQKNAPPTPSPWAASKADGRALNFDQAVKRLRDMIGDDRVDMVQWRRLLGQELLDELATSQRFERILVEMLEARVSRITQSIHAAPLQSREWLELIEDRYGWKADGLRFQSLFPSHLDVLMYYAEMRRSLGLDPQLQVMQPAYSWNEWPLSFLKILFTPGILALASVFFTMFVFGEAARSQFFRPFIGGLLLILFMWWVLPDSWKEVRSSIPAFLRGGGLGRWLRRRPAAVLGLNSLTIMLLCLFAVLVVRPNLQEGWVSPKDVLGNQTDILSWRNDLPRRIVPDRLRVERAARALSRNAIDAAEALGRMEMPYPKVVLSFEPGATGEVPPARKAHGGSHLTCDRQGACLMSMVMDFPVNATVSTGKTERFPFQQIYASWKWQLGAPLASADLYPKGFEVPLDVAFLAARSGDADEKRINYSSTLLVTVGDLSLQHSADNRTAQLRFLPYQPERGGLKIANCEAEFINRPWRELADINPRVRKLMAEICSLPSDMVGVSFDAAAPAVQQDSGEITMELSRPPQRLILGLLPGKTPKIGRNDVEVSRLALTTSDRIIQDYLTIFWSSPRPDDLTAYLEHRPHIIVPQAPPDQTALLAAVRNQPHLTHAYRFRSKLGMAVLDDMFRFLEERGLLDLR